MVIHFSTLLMLIIYIRILIYAIIFFELLYSLYKKDGLYQGKQAINNLLNLIVASGFVKVFDGTVIVTAVILFLNKYLGYQLFTQVTLSIEVLLVSIVLVDFIHFLFHKFHHKIRILWMLHFVHHSDRLFNITSLVRNPIMAIFTLTIYLIPVLFLDIPIQYALIASHIVHNHEYITHSPYIKFPKFLEYIFISPQSHRIHHSQDERHQNSNYGAMFSIWDRLFDSYISPYRSDVQNIKLGIKNYQQDNFFKYQLDPIIDYVRNTRKYL